ncbi:MAG TPA: winged helix-turn-helix domain-containing protein [Pyrinomonadaceae bacterium]|nr:winged helix-turn-helix domain-containing protein [Pyrinomonadaceae bacterium]
MLDKDLSTTLYRFGSFELDPSERSLFKRQESISLTPKAFDTLCLLVENSGRLVTKAELLDKVWPETYVEEKTLAQNIFTLRKTLGTDDEGRNYIETVPKQGYRFSADVFKFPRRAEDIVADGKTEFRIHVVVKRLLPALLIVALFGVIVFVSKDYWTNAPSFSRVSITKLTNAGDVGPMALSPDGNHVVYVKRGPGQQSLVVRQTASTSLLEIVPPQKIGFIGAAFSPDGGTIFYVTRPYGGNISTVYRIPLLGGTPVKVVDDADSPATVSPDGKQLAFIRLGSNGRERKLVITPTDGTDEKVLASTNGEYTFGLHGPAWSPDQKLIAVSTFNPRAQSGGYGISVVDVQSGSIKQVGNDDWNWMGQAAWSAAGDELVVTAAAGSDPALADQIWIVSYPSGEARRITNDVDGHLGLGLSHKQSMIASVVSDRHGTFWISDAQDAKRATQTTRVSGDRSARSLGMSWMADNRLVYSSQVSGAAELWTMRADGGDQRQLTSDRRGNTMPVATADGQYIVYLSGRANERRVSRVNVDGSDLKELTQPSAIAGVSVTPDSKWIVYAAIRDQSPSLMKVSIDGGGPSQLSQANATFPSVSPDGKSVACYVVTTDRKRRLSIISFDTGEIIKQFDVFLEYNLPWLKWTPDGKAIAYEVSANGVSNIWKQPIADGAPEQVTNWDSDVIFRFDWSKDGRLAVERGMFTNDIILIRDQE